MNQHGSEISCQYIIRYETHTERAVGQQSGYAVVLHFFYQEDKGQSGKDEGQYDVNSMFHNKISFVLIYRHPAKKAGLFLSDAIIYPFGIMENRKYGNMSAKIMRLPEIERTGDSIIPSELEAKKGAGFFIARTVPRCASGVPAVNLLILIKKNGSPATEFSPGET